MKILGRKRLYFSVTGSVVATHLSCREMDFLHQNESKYCVPLFKIALIITGKEKNTDLQR